MINQITNQILSLDELKNSTIYSFCGNELKKRLELLAGKNNLISSKIRKFLLGFNNACANTSRQVKIGEKLITDFVVLADDKNGEPKFKAAYIIQNEKAGCYGIFESPVGDFLNQNGNKIAVEELVFKDSLGMCCYTNDKRLSGSIKYNIADIKEPEENERE